METRYRNVVWKGKHAKGEVACFAERASDMVEGKIWSRFSDSLDLMVIRFAWDNEIPGARQAISSLRDGRPQGWDWGEITDSSRGAIAAMFAKAKELLALVPIRWVPCLNLAPPHIDQMEHWHPDCFAAENNLRRSSGRPLRPWADLLTCWPPGECCVGCQQEEPPKWDWLEDSPLAKANFRTPKRTI